MSFWKLVMPPPAKARHVKRTLLFSPDDDPGKPSRELIDLVLHASRLARDIDVSDISERMPSEPAWTEFWPGEHYRLLAGIVQILHPKTVIEIGTFTGLSALSLLKFMPSDAKLYTFDLIDWREIPGSYLREEDFADGRLVQVLADLADKEAMKEHADKLKDAPFLFVDGPKDKKFEPAFLENLREVPFEDEPFLLFDDIKDWNMLKIWREITMPKMDVTSLGHWTGTGMLQWKTGGDK